MTSRHILTIASLALVLLVSVPLHAEPNAAAFLGKVSQRAVEQLSDPDTDDAERTRRFRTLFNQAFDIPAVGRFVLGRYWRDASESQRDTFLKVFEDVIVRQFLPLFREYGGASLLVGREQPLPGSEGYLTVSSKILRGKDAPLSVEWRIHVVGNGSYKIVDIVAEGVSIGLTLRSEYTSILRQHDGDVSVLIDKLRAKAAAPA